MEAVGRSLACEHQFRPALGRQDIRHRLLRRSFTRDRDRADENESVTEAAEKYFKRYTKARNAKQEIETRRAVIEGELSDLHAKGAELESAIEAEDETRIADLGGKSKQPAKKISAKRVEETKGARSFVSSDGFEILVGKKAKDNDFLTFRIAKSLDTWMHAADYPGSHVVIRNPNRKRFPIGLYSRRRSSRPFTVKENRSRSRGSLHAEKVCE
jgi:predicted ribosome quality control (RQC) complex YloA/Tae2 family protein